MPEQPDRGSTADYCSRWPGEPHAMTTHIYGGALVSVRMCSFCDWIDFGDLDDQVRALIAEGLRQATEGTDAVLTKTDAAWGEGYAEGRKELVEAADAGYHRGVLVGLRQATEGWEREWYVRDPGLTWPALFEDEGAARDVAARDADRTVVSRLVGPWEPAEQPERAAVVREDDPLSCGECYDIAHDELDERETCDEHAAEQPEGS